MTGGVDEYQMDVTDSTETYDHSTGRWVITRAKLPTLMTSLRAITIDNRILIFGMIFLCLCLFLHSNLFVVFPGGNKFDGEQKTSDTILEYDITGDSYKEIGHMLDKRFSHAVSVVQYSDFSPWCQQFNIEENKRLSIYRLYCC